ncbi:hypothetical protein [Haliangium ochraceum]|uniref:Sulfotransferase family protein n=1 Tax=Haliangium ochraceum (strain DSM 14365 / JCM 11303 / SMP-2) TaxID=502025 RepID=D0LH73_HALO1|nr:hypothetical protein [Haliangium ochraceum]ACY18218.1 conserved hypothetical protein [Haliangium ochraceum DSM 14365]
MNRRIALWTTPRAISTAFERAFMQRDDTRVVHEPFSGPYYFGPERVSARYREQPVDPAQTYAAVADALRGSSESPVAAAIAEASAGSGPVLFLKDMAYFLAGRMDAALLGDFQHTFLIRDPRRAVPSLHAMSLDSERTGWSYFDPEEAGFRQLHELFVFATETLGQPPVVVDAADLLAAPEPMLRAYCEAVGLAFQPAMLRWPAQPVAAWTRWQGWHDGAQSSTGFTKARQSPLPDQLPREVETVIQTNLPFYQTLYTNRIRLSDRVIAIPDDRSVS